MTHADRRHRHRYRRRQDRVRRRRSPALLDGMYWKPVQAGLDGETDSETVARLAGLSPGRILPEAYRLTQPLLAASRRRARRRRRSTRTASPCPTRRRPLIIEGAGGVLVPLTREHLLDRPVRALGAAGGALRPHRGSARSTTRCLSIEALRRARDPAPRHRLHRRRDGRHASERSPSSARCGVLGRLPHLDPLDRRDRCAQRCVRFRRRRLRRDFAHDAGPPVWHPFTQHALEPDDAVRSRAAEGA